MHRRHGHSAGWLSILGVALSLPICGGCGAGAVAVLAGLFGDDGGGDDSGAPQVAGIAVRSTKFSPAEVVLTVSNPGGARTAIVRLHYTLPGLDERPLIIGEGDTNRQEVALPESASTTLTPIEWRFTGVDELMSGALSKCVVVRAEIEGSTGSNEEGIDQATIDVGNDLPVVSDASIDVLDLNDQGEAGQVTRIRFRVVDSKLGGCVTGSTSADDTTYVRLDFRRGGDESPFVRATVFGESKVTVCGSDLDAPMDPSCFAFFAEPATGGEGTEYTFLWDVLTDVGPIEDDVIFRITPYDRDDDPRTGPSEFLRGTSGFSRTFRVDNNQPPIGVVSGDAFVLNGDQRRGIPIPFSVRDAEGDAVNVVFQWTLAGRPFDDLPDRVPDLLAILADPAARVEKRIMTESPLSVGGRVEPVDDSSLPSPGTRVELPEIAAEAATILSPGGPGADLAGRVLEILRPSSVPTAAGLDGRPDPPVLPSSAIPVDDGSRAIVLEATAARSWRIRIFDVATGSPVELEEGRTTVTESSPATDVDSGDAAVMVLEPDKRSLLVADDNAGLWRLLRVGLGGSDVDGDSMPDPVGTRVELVRNDGFAEMGSIRGLAPLSGGSAAATVGTSLLRLEYAPCDVGAGSCPGLAVTVLTALETPWGVVRDPTVPSRVFVAERDHLGAGIVGRVLSVDVHERISNSFVFDRDGTPPLGLTRPESLALESPGNRLLAITDRDPGDGEKEISAIDLDRRTVPPPSIESPAYVVVARLPESATAIATDANGSRFVSLPALNDIAVAGGVSQRRTIAGFDRDSRIATVRTPFDPSLDRGERWRIRDAASVVKADAGGAAVSDTFVWDSTDAASGGAVRVRLVTFDTDVDSGTETLAPRIVRADADVVAESPILSDDPDRPLGEIAVGDLNGDGRQDIVQIYLSPAELAVFLQDVAGEFLPQPRFGAGGLDIPFALAIADIDADGLADIVCANAGGENEGAVFFQNAVAPGEFMDPPLFLNSGRTPIEQSEDIAIADLDGNGLPDVVLANPGSDDLSTYSQVAARVFVAGPPIGRGVINNPIAVDTADFDRDGLLDVVSANRGNRDITIFRQSGGSPGAFDPVPNRVGTVPALARPQSMRSADLDGNGRPDLVVTDTDPSDLTAPPIIVLLQNGEGGFTEAGPRLGGRGVARGLVSIRLADVEPDGDLDILGPAPTIGAAVAFIQAAPGRFDERPVTIGRLAGGVSLTSATSADSGDVDGDGRTDFVLAGTAPDSSTGAFTFLQSSGRGFDPIPLSLAQDSELTPATLAVGDLDSDGDLDLVVASAQRPGSLVILPQSSPRLFSASPIVLSGSSEITLDGPLSLDLADLNGDGRLEILSANSDTGGGSRSANVTIFGRIDEASPFTLFQPIDVPGPLAVLAVAVGDMNDDGYLDVVICESVPHNVLVCFQDPGPPGRMPTFSTRARLLATPHPDFNTPTSIDLVDLDGNGRLDVVTANIGSDNVTWFLQAGDGSFTGPFERRLNDDPVSVASRDVDLDGLPDLVVAVRGGDRIAVLFQDGPAGFAPRLDIECSDGGCAVPRRPQSVAIGDVDADGFPDIVVASGADGAGCGGSDIVVFRQVGRRRFECPGFALGGAAITDNPSAVLVADIDGDGDLDIASSNQSTPQALQPSVTVFFANH